MKLEPEIEELLVAFWNGELDDGEEKKVEEWLSSCDEHRNAYEDFMRDYLKLRWVFESQSIHHEQVKMKTLSAIKRKKSRWLYSGSIAALVAGVCFLVAILLPERKEKQEDIIELAGLEHNGKEALLVLSTGEEIILSGNKHEICEQYGLKLQIDSVNRLNYDTIQNLSSNEVIYNDIIVPRKGEYQVVLSDGSKVFLNSESELKVPVIFSGSERRVYLKGEGYFEVSPDLNRPFIVSVNGMDITVLGTKFNVNAYCENQNIKATLVSGKVRVTNKNTFDGVVLIPGQQAVCSNGEILVKEVDVQSEIAWIDGKFCFEKGATLEDISEQLKRWYDIEFFFTSEDVKKYMFAGVIKKEYTANEIFSIIEKTTNVKFTMKGRTVIVSK